MTMDAERSTKGLWLSDELRRTPYMRTSQNTFPPALGE
jgi:hypothetical protein